MNRRPPLGGGQTRHADDWLMTYADTITLLLCLFVVLLALHGAQPHGAAHAGAPASAGAPVTFTLPQTAIIVAPLPELAGMPPPRDDADDDPRDRLTYPDSPPTRQAPPATGRSSADPAPSVSFDTAAVAKREPVPVAHSVPKAAPASPAAGAPHTTDSDHATDPPLRVATPLHAEATTAPEQGSDRITIFQFSSAAFFESGSANLSDSGQSLLASLLGRLQSPKFAAYRITVEGHTDDEPISSSQFPSNWELSAARAAAVVRFFVEHAIPAHRLRAAGYADTRPLAPNRDVAGDPIPENQAKNRRVVIELEKIDHEEN
jgi:flagellar motor protein MotB